MLKANSSYKNSLKTFLTELNISISIEKFEKLLKILNKNPKGIISYKETFEVIDQLKNKYKLAILTNADPIAFELLNE